MGCICGKPVKAPSKHNTPIKAHKRFNNTSDNLSKQSIPPRPSDTSHDSVASSAPLPIPPPSNVPMTSPKYQAPKVEFPAPPAPKKIETFPVGSIPLPPMTFYNFEHDLKSGDFERSHLNDWQSLLKQNCNFSFVNLYSAISSSNCDNLAVKTSWDRKMHVDLCAKILSLPPRQWVKEHMYLLNKSSQAAGDISGVSIQRKTLQMEQHFKWFVWAVASYLYVNLGKSSRHFGREFIELSGVKEDLGLPKKFKEWLNGFMYKNVRFKLVYARSEEGRLYKSEAKALKLFCLACGVSQISRYNLTLPLVVYVNIGTFILFAVPSYPPNFLGSSPDITVDLFGDQNFQISSSNLYRLKFESEEQKNKETKPCLLVYDLYKIVPTASTPSYLCLFSCAGPEIRIFDTKYTDSIPINHVVKAMYGDAEHPNAKIISNKISKYGWDCYVFFDENPAINRRNPVASLFGEDIYGDAVVSFHMSENFYLRFPIFGINEHEISRVKRRSVRDTIHILESSENYTNHEALKELFHRKGLNMYYEWVVFSKTRHEKSRALVGTDILARAVKNLVWQRMAEERLTPLSKYNELILNTILPLLHLPSKKTPQNLELTLILFLGRLKSMKDSRKIRRKSEKSVSRLIEPGNMKKNSFEYYLSDEILKQVLSSASRSPALFLDAIQYHCSVFLKEETLCKARADGYFFLCNDPVLHISDLENLHLTIFTQISLREENYIILLSFLERGGPKRNDSKDMMNDSFADWVSEANVELISKEEEHQSLELILPCDLYKIPGNSLYRDNYDVPSLQILEEWANCVETLFRDLITVDGEETALIEILIYVITQRYFLDMDTSRCNEYLQRIANLINNSVYTPPELVIAYYLWNALIQEQSSLAQAEQHYITALMLMTKLFGDPRGRGNLGVPWQIVASWKLSQIAREERRYFDAQAADEHFDAVFMNTKQFQQQLAKVLKGRSSRQNEIMMKHPFEHWSMMSPQRLDMDPLYPESKEVYFAWMFQHSLPMYQSGKLWSNLLTKCIVKNTLVQQLSTHYSLANQLTSGTSTPSSHKDTRRAIQQSSLTQVLLPEFGALNMADMRGIVYVWGTDSAGQLGLAISEDEFADQVVLPYPRMMTSLKDIIIKEVSAGAEHCIAIALDGSCYAWGNNEYAQLGLGPDMPKIIRYPVHIKTIANISKAACGYQHSVFLSSDHKVYTVGSGDGGVLGHGNTHLIMYPKMIQSLKNTKIYNIKVGAFHTIAVSREGHLYVWGRGEGGQLGLQQEDLIKVMRDLGIASEDPYIHTPRRLYGELANKRIIQVACGEAHTLALTDNNEVYGWGWGSNGQLATGVKHDDFDEVGNVSCIQYTPLRISTLEGLKIKEIAAGGLFSIFLTEENEILACGMNDFGQLGLENQDKVHKDISVPTKLDCFSGYPIHYLVCGENHTIATSGEHDKMTWAWGRCKEGQLGLGDISHLPAPRPIQSLSSSPVYMLACGRMHSMAIVGNPGNIPRAEEEIEGEIKWEIVYIKSLKGFSS